MTADTSHDQQRRSLALARLEGIIGFLHRDGRTEESVERLLRVWPTVRARTRGKHLVLTDRAFDGNRFTAVYEKEDGVYGFVCAVDRRGQEYRFEGEGEDRALREVGERRPLYFTIEPAQIHQLEEYRGRNPRSVASRSS